MNNVNQLLSMERYRVQKYAKKRQTLQGMVIHFNKCFLQQNSNVLNNVEFNLLAYSALSYTSIARGRQLATPFNPQTVRVIRIVSLISSLVAPSFFAMTNVRFQKAEN